MKREIRVYVLDANLLLVSYEKLSDKEFIEAAEEMGSVHTLPSFQEAFNDGDIDTSVEVIRILNVEIVEESPNSEIPFVELD